MLLRGAAAALSSLSSLNGRLLAHGDSEGRRSAMCVMSFLHASLIHYRPCPLVGTWFAIQRTHCEAPPLGHSSLLATSLSLVASRLGPRSAHVRRQSSCARHD
jgi:hypothetical protein